jgi:hypothetical protein
MSVQYTVTLTQAENMALSHVTLSQQDWIDNAVHERCKNAIDEIVKICVDKCLENNIQIPGSKDDMVLLSFQRGWVKTGEEINQEMNQQ